VEDTDDADLHRFKIREKQRYPRHQRSAHFFLVLACPI